MLGAALYGLLENDRDSHRPERAGVIKQNHPVANLV